MYYTPLANYSVSENNPIRTSVRPPMMADMTAISPTTGELMVPGNAGVVIQAKSGDNAIRVSGTATTTAGLVSNGTTANQIQFYSNGDITAAFDSRGLYLVDNDWINIGSGKIVIYTGAGNLNGNLVIGTATSGSKLTGGGLYNTFIGQTNGEENTTGSQNTFVGYGAGRQNTTGAYNTNFGVNAGQDNTIGDNNTNIGKNAGIKQTGHSSVYIGANAGGGNNIGTGVCNVSIGLSAGFALTSGSRNNLIGGDSGKSITSGSGNQFIGLGAGQQVTIGEFNVGIGHYAGASFQESTASRNTSVGAYSGERLTNGQNNTLVGYAAGALLTTGDRNTIIGKDAGYAMTTGLVNVCIGEGAGNNITTGQNNTIIGQGTRASSGTTHNEIVIGSNAIGNGAGTSTIAGSLWLSNNVNMRGGIATAYWNSVNDNFWHVYSDTNLNFSQSGGYRLWLPSGTASTTFSNNSDVRLKTNIENAPNILQYLLQLQVKTYNYLSHPNDPVNTGFIAQEVQQIPILSQMVCESDKASPDGDKYLGINQSILLPYLVKGMQEQNQIIVNQQKQIDELKLLVNTLLK